MPRIRDRCNSRLSQKLQTPMAWWETTIPTGADAMTWFLTRSNFGNMAALAAIAALPAVVAMRLTIGW